MSKKNNKARKKKYVEMTKQLEKEREEEAKRKKEKKLANISANALVDKIEDIGIDEEKDDKMDIDKKVIKHHKMKGFRRKHGRYA